MCDIEKFFVRKHYAFERGFDKLNISWKDEIKKF